MIGHHLASAGGVPSLCEDVAGTDGVLCIRVEGDDLAVGEEVDEPPVGIVAVGLGDRAGKPPVDVPTEMGAEAEADHVPRIADAPWRTTGGARMGGAKMVGSIGQPRPAPRPRAVKARPGISVRIATGPATWEVHRSPVIAPVFAEWKWSRIAAGSEKSPDREGSGGPGDRSVMGVSPGFRRVGSGRALVPPVASVYLGFARWIRNIRRSSSVTSGSCWEKWVPGTTFSERAPSTCELR